MSRGKQSSVRHSPEGDLLNYHWTGNNKNWLAFMSFQWAIYWLSDDCGWTRGPNSLALTSHLTGFGSEARCCIHGTGINDRLGSTWKTVPYCIDMNPADKYKQLRYDCMNWVSSFRKKRKIIPKAASAVHLDLGRYWDSSAVHALVVTRERKIFCAKVLERTSIITKSERAWVDITQSEISIVSFANESVQPIGHKHFSWDWLEIWASW